MIKRVFITSLFLSLNFCLRIVNAQPRDIQFNSFTNKDGLSNNIVNAVFQDHEGYIWIGTEDGLNKFDAYKFTSFRHDPKDPNSISGNSIQALWEDKMGNLWIGTSNGLNLYDRKIGKFKNYFFSKDDPSSLSNNFISARYLDKNGNVWIGAWNCLDKLVVDYDQKGNLHSVKFLHFFKGNNNINSKISSIGEDSEGNIWVGRSKEALFKLNPKSKEVTFFEYDPKSLTSISHPYIKSIYKDANNKLWFGTWGKGLNFLNENNNGFTHIKDFPLRSQNEINAVFEDSDKNFWLGTEYGLLLYNRQKQIYKEYIKGSKEHEISKNNITVVYEDNNKGIWIGTYGGGVNYFNLRENKFKYYSCSFSPDEFSFTNSLQVMQDQRVLLGTSTGLSIFDPLTQKVNKINLPGGAIDIQAVYQAKSHHLYIGSKKGMALYKIDSNKFQKLSLPSRVEDLLKNKIIHHIREDSLGAIWISTGNGLLIIDKENKIKKYYHLDHPDDLWTNYVLQTFSDPTGQDWLVVSSSLVKMIPDGDSIFFKYYKADNYKKDWLNDGGINSLLFDSKQNFWITTNGGLTLFDPKKEIFKNFQNNVGTKNNYFLGVLEDNTHNLWLSTHDGFLKFNYSTKKFKNYNLNEEIKVPFFPSVSCAKSKNGDMYFAAEGGFFLFNPDSIIENSIAPRVVFTGLKIFNKTIYPGPGSPLENDISETKEIVLDYDKSMITIEFSALSYQVSQKNKYAYMLQGLDKDWNYSGTRHEATYSNLAPGSYTFIVKAQNNDGIWNKKGRSLHIIILPPFWATWWFRLLGAVFILGAAFQFYRVRINRLNKQNILLQSLVGERTKELKETVTELVKVNATKDKFFSIIAHDLKNPFNGILFFSELLSSKYEEHDEKEKKEFASYIHNSSRSAYSLLENLLNWASSQTNNIKFNPENFDLYDTVQSILNLLKLNAINKGIILNIEIEKGLFVFADKNMVSTILRNLLHNAIKYTGQSGRVEITFIPKEEFIEISIHDSGIGMDPQILKELFIIDHQNSRSGTIGEAGTGLGLIICKEFADKNGGSIRAESEVGKGSIFILTLPKGKPVISSTENMVNDSLEEVNLNYEQDIPSNEVSIIGTSSNTPEEDLEIDPDQDLMNVGKKIILVIEDTPHIRINIKKCLEKDYEILEAENGNKGLILAYENIPDLVITDLMMPEMNGFDLCHAIKTNELVSHIPIIMLTGNSSDASKLQGLEIGADDYLTKPFNPEILKVRVKNLIKSREELRKRFSRELKLEAKDIAITSADEKFLNKAISIVEKHLEDPEFTVIIFSEELNLSRSHLYKKLHGLTELSPNEFIRNIRLKRAGQLLKNGGSAKEIAYNVGFNDPAYFNRVFRKYYGVTTSEYVKNFLDSNNNSTMDKGSFTFE